MEIIVEWQSVVSRYYSEDEKKLYCGKQKCPLLKNAI